MHVTGVTDGQQQQIDLCEQCAPSIGFESFTIEQLEGFSVLGKNCEFCGKPAFSGQLVAGDGAIYWCSACGMEFAGILTELIKSERPDLMLPSSEEGSFAYISNPDVQEWSALATRKAVRKLKERRRQDGRDSDS